VLKANGAETGRLSPAAGFGYIPGLDGVRCIAVMLVLIAHAGFDGIVPGGLGVTIFFFISGFLITRLLLAEAATSGTVALGRFYIRRFLRLLPALYLMLVITWAILIAMGTPPKLWELITAFTYTANYLYVYHAFTGDLRVAPWEHLWSLAIEEHFYLLFPVLVLLLRNNLKRLVVACLVICALALCWRYTAALVLEFPLKYNYAATEARLDSLVWGCLLSILLQVSPGGAWRRWLTGLVPLALAAGLMLVSLLYRDEIFRETLRYSVQGIALFIAVLNLYFWRPMDWAITLLENPLFAWIGRISYGLYLWHMPVFAFTGDLTGRTVGDPVFIALAMAASFAVTAASFYLVERRITGLRKRFGSHAAR
jgi:peptidoglycan/LPS O-acetylase OafA/YrhL